MKRLLSLLLALALLIGMLPAQANALVLDNGLKYEVYEDHVEITGYTGSATEVVIPAEIEGKPVTKIGSRAFWECINLTSIVLPDGVTSISTYAFAYCLKLMNIDLPDSLTSIGNGAFFHCTRLTDIDIPDDVTSIGSEAFEGCSSLSRIKIPDGVTSIGFDTFMHCSSLINIEIPADVTSIGGSAFLGCTRLTKIIVPASVISISDNAFGYCSSLTGIHVDENNPSYSSDDRGVLFDKAKTLLLQAPGAIMGTYTIPDSVTSIGDNAFACCTRLTGIVIPGSVTSIGDDAFERCTSLTYVDVLNGVTSIGDYAFERCTSLTDVKVSGSVTSIGDYAFSYCDSLTNIYFIGDAPVFGASVFSADTVTAYYPADNATWTAEVMQDYGGRVLWVMSEAYDPGNGMFAPEDVLTRGMFAYALWNYVGSPEPYFTDRPFTDVSKSDYYYDAVYWAVESGIMLGATATQFDPDMYVNRAHVATWLWRAFGSPEPPDERPPFTDVANSEFYTDAVAWVFAEGYMHPMSSTTFNPYDQCLYGHINWVVRDHIHRFTLAVIAPTCTEQGYTSHTCDCGASYVTNSVAAQGHTYALGVCIRCGEADPNYEEIPSPSAPGNGMFAPDEVLTRGMFFYALWNFYGSPEPESTINPWMDVSESDYYFNAVFWAMENGIAGGISATQFGPDLYMNRAQAATYLWRAAGSPEPTDVNPFTDVVKGEFYYKAALWATIEELCMGPMDATHFDPNAECLYGHINWIPANHTHNFTADVTAPTCTGWGFTTYTCTYCDYSYAAKFVNASGHEYAGGVCTSCGEADPACWEPCSGMFAPDEKLTHGMFFYALWNFYGAPEPVFKEQIFTDVSESDYYFDAVCWAVETGITAGISPTQFGSNLSVLRAQTATWLWRAAGSPESTTIYNPFIDVNEIDYFYEAVLWATLEELCMGSMDAVHFDPYEECLYGHINWIPADHTHNFFDTITFTAPTCTEQGYTTFTCPCGYSCVAKYVDALGHNFMSGTCTACGEADPDYEAPEKPPFDDVPEGEWYYEPVNWAVENGITNGTSEDSFSPNDQCLRAHVVTFLWRAEKEPEPAASSTTFTDAKTTDFFYKPVLWAVEKGITNGISATKFGSYDVCNRAAVVTFLWRAAGCPEPETTGNPFTDVKTTDFFYKPVLWAVENSITNGLTATEFGPTAACNRAQVVTFLYRAYND